MKLNVLIEYLECFAPTHLAEDWDNVGLLLGDSEAEIQSAMTCLTITDPVVEEAVSKQVGLIVTHHPLPFRALKKINTDTIAGRLLWRLASSGISVYSPHTAFDSASRGINQRIAEGLGLSDISPIHISENETGSANVQEPAAGVGRTGVFPGSNTCAALVEKLKIEFEVPLVSFCGDLNATVSRVGIACGSAGQFLEDVNLAGCDAFITGEASFHTCLESHARGVNLLLMGHYGSERFAVELLAEEMERRFPDLNVFASDAESNPIQYVN